MHNPCYGAPIDNEREGEMRGYTKADGWLTRKEAAEHAGVKSTRTIDRWADEGRIERHKIAGLQHVRFRTADLDALLRGVPAPPADPFAD